MKLRVTGVTEGIHGHYTCTLQTALCDLMLKFKSSTFAVADFQQTFLGLTHQSTLCLSGMKDGTLWLSEIAVLLLYQV